MPEYLILFRDAFSAPSRTADDAVQAVEAFGVETGARDGQYLAIPADAIEAVELLTKTTRRAVPVEDSSED